MSTASHPVDSGSGFLRPAGSDPAGSDPQALRDAVIARFVGLALACVHREYPNKVTHVLDGDADVRPPRELTPAFYGCYDWHSSVHGHWLLARAARLHPDASFAVRLHRSSVKPLCVSPPGYRSSRIRSGSASIRRRPSASGSRSTGRASRTTLRSKHSSRRGLATTTAATSAVRSATSLQAKISSHPASPRRTSCGACSAAKSSGRG